MKQLEYIREQLGKKNRSAWIDIANSAGVTLRTMYKVVKEDSNPTINTVTKLHDAIKASNSRKK